MRPLGPEDKALIAALGALSAANVPDVPGMENFAPERTDKGCSAKIALIEALEDEEHHGLAVLEVQGGIHDPEGQFTPPSPVDADKGRLHQIEVVSIPGV